MLLLLHTTFCFIVLVVVPSGHHLWQVPSEVCRIDAPFFWISSLSATNWEALE